MTLHFLVRIMLCHVTLRKVLTHVSYVTSCDLLFSEVYSVYSKS
jgi:hypothetical protein